MLGFVLSASMLLSLESPQVQWPQTRAERTQFAETSHYADVMAFIHALQESGAPVSIQYMGQSTEKRDMPLVIASRPPLSTPAEARRSGKPIIYIQANIHAGEIEGKEAAQHLLREWCKEQKGILDKCVVLMTPIYNIDGNEKFGPGERNRPGQDGPAQVGLRANGQNLDLNRDCIKAESPEMRAILEHVYGKWDPDVVMDLHTTDGTRHGYELTYSPPLNPNTDPDVMKYCRDELLPSVRRELKKKFGNELFDYGNAQSNAWFTFGQEGRYVTNYAGLRNRIAVLSEAMVYLPFKERVLATERFVQSVMDHLLSSPKRIVELTRRADLRTIAWGADPSKAPELGVRFDFAGRGKEAVLMEKPVAEGAPRPRGRIKDTVLVTMPINDRFRSVKTAKFPAGYLIPATEMATVELLQRHGVVVEKFLEPWGGPCEQFDLSEVEIPTQAFQGHRLMRLEGAFARSIATAAPGSYLVRTAQPLGVLVFHLMEPQSLDGVATWGFLSAEPKVGSPFAIRKVFTAPKAKTQRL